MSNEKRKIVKEPYDKTHNIQNLHLIVTITNVGMGEAILYLIEKHGVSGQFIQRGNGTSAHNNVTDLLNMIDTNKAVMYSLVKDSQFEEVMKDLNRFLTKDKKVKGIAFAIPLETIAGRTAYHFLTQTIE